MNVQNFLNVRNGGGQWTEPPPFRRRHRRRRGHVGRPHPAPGPHLRPPLSPGRGRSSLDDIAAELEQSKSNDLGHHPRPGRVAPRAPRADAGLAQGPLRGRDQLLARHAGDHGAALSLDVRQVLAAVAEAERALAESGGARARRRRSSAQRLAGAERFFTASTRHRRLHAGKARRSRDAARPSCRSCAAAPRDGALRRTAMEPAITSPSLWLLFGGTHVGLATGRVRAWLVGRLGERGFRCSSRWSRRVTFGAARARYYAGTASTGGRAGARGRRRVPLAASWRRRSPASR